VAEVLNWMAVVLQFHLQFQAVELLGHDFKKSSSCFEFNGNHVGVPFTLSSN
jgi:hypothetical protein